MIFNINFFLFSFAQSNIWSYTFVFAKRYANVTNAQYGVLALVLPALALFAKPTSCSLADANGIHRQLLIGALAVFGISYSSLGVLAFFKDPEDHEHDTLTWMILCVVLSVGYVATACIFCMNDALASNYARKHNLSYSRMRIYASVGWASGALLIMLIGDVSWLPFRVPGIIILGIATTVDILILVLWPYPEDFEMFHDGSTVEQRKLSMVGPNTLALAAHMKPRGSISRDVLERIKAGRSKSVGNLPRIDTGLEKPSLVLPPKVKEKEPKEYSNFQCQMILMKMIAVSHKSFMRYIGLFLVFGVCQGAVWTYQFDYIGAEIAKDETEFEFISTLAMIAQSVFGEILINIFATDMIRIFGANANMSLALVSVGLRCFFYTKLLPYLSPASIMIAEALNGPSTGLYWVLIVDVGSNYALMVTDYMPELKRRGIVRDRVHEAELSGCLRASMIGMMSSSMEGLGVAIGSFLGGVLSGSLGYHAMWMYCAVVSISVGFMNIGWDICRKLLFNAKRAKAQHKSMEAAVAGIPTVVIEDMNSKL